MSDRWQARIHGMIHEGRDQAELLRELHELEREAAAGPPTPALLEAMPDAVRRAGETRRSGWEQGFMAGWRAGHAEGSAKALALLRRIVTGG